MGVYHLMGLGRSVGVVTGPLTYLAHRYQRWNADDRHFFARSGEMTQRQHGEKVGDVQGLVLFTSREVLEGKTHAFGFVDNPPGRVAKGPGQKGGPIKDVLCKLLRCEWPAISGGRRAGTIFWCEVDRRDIHRTYERVAQVVAALAGVGGQGKEVWANLTGGNNVINIALELTAMLSGDVARLYYVQAENPDAEKCVRYTAENGYWVELPVMPLTLGSLSQIIIQLLAEKGPMELGYLYSILRNDYWDLTRGVESEGILRDQYLAPLWRQGLVAETANGYIVGSQWELIRPYQESLQLARQAGLSIERLAQQEAWITRYEVVLK